MQSLPPPSLQTRLTILHRLRIFYGILTVVFAGLSISLIALNWQQPKNYGLGFPHYWSMPILLIASVLINGISFYFQNRYIYRLLQRPHIATNFRIIVFALRFYLYNLATAIALSILGFFPLLYLFFFYRNKISFHNYNLMPRIA